MMSVVDSYTSTGKKFWCWPDHMKAYRNGLSDTVISTHVSPEGACNLKCSYCSVTKRTKYDRIPLAVIKEYISTLCGYGLQAVILTGGGEPLLYPEIDELIWWLDANCLKIGLITNGTLSGCLTERSWRRLSWIRVSVNIFKGWEEKISLPLQEIAGGCTVGCSFIWSGKEKIKEFNVVSRIADKLNAEYIRLLPDCLQLQADLEQGHEKLKLLTLSLRRKDKRFFHQWKRHRSPTTSVCHQSYFRPYLSEEKYWGNELPGSVYPCDSVVLNDVAQKFEQKYQICYATEVDKFLRHEIAPAFNPRKDCSGCVFTDTVEMLGRWKDEGMKELLDNNLMHKEFV